MAEISAIPQQPQLGRLAQFLRYLETEKPEFLPSQLDVMGLVRQLTLPQASTVENLSYGNLPFTMPPSGTGAMIPQVKTGRKPEVADLIATFSGVPGMGAVADVGAKLSNTAADQLVRMITRNPQATAPQVLQETAMPLSNITTWHGSPYLFRQFDSMKVGTGEGAQAYGVGSGYTAEARPVAEEYARNISRSKFIDESKKAGQSGAYTTEVSQLQQMVGDMPIQDYYSKLELQANRLPVNKSEDAYAKLDIVERLGLGSNIPEVRQYVKDAGYSKAVQNWVEKELVPKYKPAGFLYKGDIPDEILPKFLDWDKPLSQQTPEVRSALEKLGFKADKQKIDEYSDALLAALQGTGSTNLPKQPLDLSGESIYRKLGQADVASKKLEEVGIRGIRYLDQGSRGEGKGTSNFIPFRAEDYKIQEINDIPIEQWYARGLLERPLSKVEEAKAAWEANPDNRDLYEAYRKLRLTE